MRLRIFRRELLGLAEAFQRLRQATQLLKNEAAVVVGLGHVRTNRERALAAHERLLEAIELTQDVAASVQRIGVLRPDRQRRVVVRKRLRKAHEPVEHHGAVVERVGVRRADRQGAVEAFERLLRAQKIREHDAAIIVRLGVIGVDRECLVVARQGLARAPQLPKNDATINVGLGMVGPNLEHPVIARKRFLVTAGPALNGREKGGGIEVTGVAAVEFGTKTLGLGELARFICCQRPLEEIARTRRIGHEDAPFARVRPTVPPAADDTATAPRIPARLHATDERYPMLWCSARSPLICDSPRVWELIRTGFTGGSAPQQIEFVISAPRRAI